MKRKICYLFIGAALCMITPMEGIAQNVDSKTERRMLRTGNEDYEKEKYNCYFCVFDYCCCTERRDNIFGYE